MTNIVEDIHKILGDISLGKGDISEELIEEFGEEVKQTLRDWSKTRPQEGFQLRVSNLGKPLRKLWFEKKIKLITNLYRHLLVFKFLMGIF